MQTTPCTEADGFGVYDEWGRLREVFVGRADTFQFGRAWNPIYEIASKEFQQKWKANLGKKAAIVWPEYTEPFQAQLNALEAAYKKLNVKVHRPRAMTEIEIDSDPMLAGQGVWQASPADAQWVIGRNYIETAMRIPLPRNNYLWARDVFLPKLDPTISDPDRIADGTSARWLSCPHSTPTNEPLQALGPYLDGGDILLVGNGKDVLVGLDENSTNAYGIDWLQGVLADDGYTVWPTTFNMIAMHLSGQLNLINPGLMIVSPEGFSGHELPKPIADWDRIEISHKDVLQGGADCVMVDEKNAICSAAQHNLMEQLSNKGIEPHPVDISKAFEASSGVRCCSIHIHREKSIIS